MKCEKNLDFLKEGIAALVLCDNPAKSNMMIINTQSVDAVFTKFRDLGSSLNQVDTKNGWFFQIIFELMDATLSNYQQFKTGYCTDNNSLLAWACRNLLELTIFTKYVLISEANARRFADDRLIDGCDIFTSLRTLELHLDPKSDTKLLDEALTSMQAQMTAEAVAEKKYLSTAALAAIVGMKEDFTCMNRVCSKLVHPTAWSVLAVNKGENCFPAARDILFVAGAGYGCDMYSAIKAHNETYGMKPKL